MPDNTTLHVGGVQYNNPVTRKPIRLTSAAGTDLFTVDATGVVTTPGGVLLNSVTLRTGFVPLPLTDWRLIASNDVGALAASGGTLAVDSAPKLIRVNAATDKKLRIQWAATSVIEITQNFAYPPDLDDTAVVTFNMLANMGGATDIPVVAVGYFENIGDTNAGGNTAAVTGVTLTQYSCTIAAADVGAYPASASISLIPAAHGTDTLNVYSTWIEYTRK